MRKWIPGLLVAASLMCVCSTAAAQEPGWSANIIAFGQQRARIEATPIVQRSYRPLHFYGNTVRRRYYHGSALVRGRTTVRSSASPAGGQ